LLLPKLAERYCASNSRLHKFGHGFLICGDLEMRAAEPHFSDSSGSRTPIAEQRDLLAKERRLSFAVKSDRDPTTKEIIYDGGRQPIGRIGGCGPVSRRSSDLIWRRDGATGWPASCCLFYVPLSRWLILQDLRYQGNSYPTVKSLRHIDYLGLSAALSAKGYVVRQDLSEDPETFHFDFTLPVARCLSRHTPMSAWF
jgi:hypothetical protein